MKKLLKIPALLFALMLIVSSCGGSAKSDAERIINTDAERIINTDLIELRSDAESAKGKKQIKLYEEVAGELEELIEILEYYSEDEDLFDKLIEAIKELDEAKRMPDYKNFKNSVELYKEVLNDWNEALEELKDGL